MNVIEALEKIRALAVSDRIAVRLEIAELADQALAEFDQEPPVLPDRLGDLAPEFRDLDKALRGIQKAALAIGRAARRAGKAQAEEQANQREVE